MINRKVPASKIVARRVVGASTLWMLAGCAAFHQEQPTRQPDGTYKVACPRPLNQCLVSLEPICTEGYDVIRAEEEREHRGPPPWDTVASSSEAVVRCRQTKALVTTGAAESAAPASAAPAGGTAATTASPPAPAPAPAAQPTCFRGTSQACVGPGGCPGAQTCGDGHAFGPCECGPAAHDGGAPNNEDGARIDPPAE